MNMSSELIKAVKAKNTIEVRRLISAGCDLERTDDKNMTALLHACEVQSFDILKALVDAGANVNHIDDLGCQPVDIAYWNGEFRMGAYTTESQRMVRYLERHGGKSSFKK
tara:strand:- start:2354 stop:2683 length:330 start_codon:yes stop_codon:yes gene_type:complete